MAHQQQLETVERLAIQMYNGDTDEARKKAQSTLMTALGSAESIPQLRMLLEFTRNQHALMFASQALSKLLATFWHSLSPSQSSEMRQWLFGFLGQRLTTFPNFIAQSLAQCTMKACKLGWRLSSNDASASASDTIAQDVMKSLQQFLQHGPQHHCLALRMMCSLIELMDADGDGSENRAEHRKSSRLFRDQCLLTLCQMALQSLQQTLSIQAQSASQLPQTGAAQYAWALPPHAILEMRQSALDVLSSALAFDFVGVSSVGDQAEQESELTTLHPPMSWRSFFEGEPSALIRTIVEVFRASCGPASPNFDPDSPAAQVRLRCLNVLSACACVRRSLFSSDALKFNYCATMLKSAVEMFEHRPTDFALPLTPSDDDEDDEEADPPLTHAFCRFLARFKHNWTTSDLQTASALIASTLTQQSPSAQFFTVPAISMPMQAFSALSQLAAQITTAFVRKKVCIGVLSLSTFPSLNSHLISCSCNRTHCSSCCTFGVDSCQSFRLVRLRPLATDYRVDRRNLNLRPRASLPNLSRSSRSSPCHTSHRTTGIWLDLPRLPPRHPISAMQCSC